MLTDKELFHSICNVSRRVFEDDTYKIPQGQLNIQHQEYDGTAILFICPIHMPGRWKQI